MLIRKLVYGSLVLTILGCTVSQSNVYGNNSAMNKSTKISKVEAISIARDYVIQKGWSNEYRVDKVPKAELQMLRKYEDGTLSWTKFKTKMSYVEMRDRWAVTFAPQKSFFKGGFYLFVLVNAETGEVEDAGNYKY